MLGLAMTLAKEAAFIRNRAGNLADDTIGLTVDTPGCTCSRSRSAQAILHRNSSERS